MQTHYLTRSYGTVVLVQITVPDKASYVSDLYNCFPVCHIGVLLLEVGKGARKKQIHGGYKLSTTRMLTQIGTLLTKDPPSLLKLSQLKLSIQEKLETI